MAAEEVTIMIVVIMVMTILSMIVIYASRYKKVPPNKAMVIYGRKMR